MVFAVGEFVIEMDAKFYNQDQIWSLSLAIFVVVKRYHAEVQKKTKKETFHFFWRLMKKFAHKSRNCYNKLLTSSIEV